MRYFDGDALAIPRRLHRSTTCRLVIWRLETTLKSWGRSGKESDRRRGPRRYHKQTTKQPKPLTSLGPPLDQIEVGLVRFRRCLGGSFSDARQLRRPSHSGHVLDDLAVLDPKNDLPCEMHPSSRVRRKEPDKQICEARSGVGAAAFQTANDVVVLRYEVRSVMKF